MKYNYNKIFKQLIDLNMNKKDLAKQAEISLSTLQRMREGKSISISSLMKISQTLQTDVSSILPEVEE